MKQRTLVVISTTLPLVLDSAIEMPWESTLKKHQNNAKLMEFIVSAGMTQEENVSLDHRCRMLCEAGTERVVDLISWKANGKLKDVWKGGRKFCMVTDAFLGMSLIMTMLITGEDGRSHSRRLPSKIPRSTHPVVSP